MWKWVNDHLSAGPEWMSETVMLPEAPNEPQIFYYHNIIECLKYLQQNPAFEGFMPYEPVLWFTDEQLT